jgi:hypothetical protein
LTIVNQIDEKVLLNISRINKIVIPYQLHGAGSFLRRGSGGIAPPFLTSALDEGKWSASSPGHFIPRERG